VRRIWTLLKRRRTITWVGILGVTALVFVSITRGLTPEAVGKPALSWLIALIAWALAVLFWDLAIVWIEYVAGARHLKYLQEVWGLEAEAPERIPAAAQADARERVWWTRR